MSNRNYKRATQLTPEERRRQLLRCAIAAFAANGLGRGTHAQVAKLAGVAVPTVFSYFPTREDLVDGVLNEIESVLLGIVRTDLQREDLTAFDKLFNLLSAYVTAIKEDPDIVKVFLDWTTSFEAGLAAKFQMYLAKLMKLLAQIIEQGQQRKEFSADVTPIDAALMIYSSANVLAQIKFYNYGVDDNHYILSLINSVLHLQDHGGEVGRNPIVTQQTPRKRKTKPTEKTRAKPK